MEKRGEENFLNFSRSEHGARAHIDLSASSERVTRVSFTKMAKSRPVRKTIAQRPSSGSLRGAVAVVAGATRGAGRSIARALGEAGATVYVTGRSVVGNRSHYNRPETI